MTDSLHYRLHRGYQSIPVGKEPVSKHARPQWLTWLATRELKHEPSWLKKGGAA